MHLSNKVFINKAYQKIKKEFGPQFWWPGDSAFEIIIGAILTQNTNWGNVEKAIHNLKTNKALTPRSLNKLSHSKLASLIRPAGYFNVKATRLQNFMKLLFDEFNGNLSKLARLPVDELRKILLSVNGIGPETADSIILYAFHKRSFVIDAYTKRILVRHNRAEPKATYDQMKMIFEGSLPQSRQLYNEYHALIVKVGKNYCKPTPKCSDCPLKDLSLSSNYKKFALK